jgi:TM2 domain-containing membrane protein YozV
MALAWGLMCPLAIGASLCRHWFRPGVFFKIHMMLNSTVVALTLIALALAYKATEIEGLSHFDEVTHRKLGLMIIVMAVLQALGGIFRPHLPHQAEVTSEHSTDAADNGADISNSDDVEDATKTKGKSPSDTTPPPSKSLVRQAWEVGHRLLGFTAVALALVNCTSGLDQFYLKFPDEGDASTPTIIFWIIVSLIACSTVAGVVHRIWFQKKENATEN